MFHNFRSVYRLNQKKYHFSSYVVDVRQRRKPKRQRNKHGAVDSQELSVFIKILTFACVPSRNGQQKEPDKKGKTFGKSFRG